MDKVIYRKFGDGEIIALFPEISASNDGYFCQSYMHVGQHGAATPDIVIRQTKLATPAEYAKLHKELRCIGYNPVPAKKFSTRDFLIRKSQWAPSLNRSK